MNNETSLYLTGPMRKDNALKVHEIISTMEYAPNTSAMLLNIFKLNVSTIIISIERDDVVFSKCILLKEHSIPTPRKGTKFLDYYNQYYLEHVIGVLEKKFSVTQTNNLRFDYPVVSNIKCHDRSSIEKLIYSNLKKLQTEINKHYK